MSPLYSYTEVLVNRLLSDGRVSLQLVQALLVLIYWKPLGDKTAWIRLGLAIRIAHQLRFNEPRDPIALGVSTDAWLRRLDEERTYNSKLIASPDSVSLR
jgi:hypothetical protein